MSLRGRLAVLFVAVTAGGLAVMTVALGLQTGRELRSRARAELAGVRAISAQTVEGARDRASDVASDVQALVRDDPDGMAGWLPEALGPRGAERADAVVVADADGRVLGAVSSPQVFAGGLAHEPDDLVRAARERTALPGVLLEVRESSAGTVVVGIWADRDLLESLPVDGAAIISAGRVIATSGGPRPANGVLATSEPLATSSDMTLVLWTPAGAQVLGPGWWFGAASLALIALAGWLVAMGLVAPVGRAARAAARIAGGDHAARLEALGSAEVVDLANALDGIRAELAGRTDLRRSLSRLGQTLSSSLDLGRTLAVVVETAMDALAADRALLMLMTPERDALYAKVGRGAGTDVPRLRLGQGRIGGVAQSGTPLRLPGEHGTALAPFPGEPEAASQVLVPLLGRGQVIGVLSLLRDRGEGFQQADVDTLMSFAAQASVAIENVMLHREAQRLSVTDQLTGLWNFRYFQIQADRELESAARSQRPLSLVIIDIDHFKTVNDRRGHQIGDEVLSEVARRIRDSTRVPDVVARYGGEEFLVLLPGTNAGGAVATAERIRQAVGAAPVQLSEDFLDGRPGGRLPVTCSVGVSTYPAHGQTLAGLLRAADAAMYVAKARGRDRVVAAPTE